MNADRKTRPQCASCGKDISNKATGHSVVAPGGTKYPVCSDLCSRKICDSLQGRRKAVGVPTVREQQIAKETDRFLRELGIA
jgi:hypothetical protein